MITILVFLSLAGYAIRYAYSGADNALYYKEKYDKKWPDAPHIHNVEAAQEWAAHLSHFFAFWAVTMAMGWPWWYLVGLSVSIYGAALIGDYWFNRWIMKVLKQPKPERWYWPMFKWRVPELFHGRWFWLEPIVGVALVFGGAIIWANEWL